MTLDVLQLYKPHKGQQKFHADNSRFRILACGRRWGKTIACVNEIVSKAWEKPGSMNWWVAPVYEQAELAMDMIRNHFPDVIEYTNKSKMVIVLKNKSGNKGGAEIRFKSGEKINNLRGWGVDFLVIDEAAFVKEEAWVEALRPTLSDKLGRAVFIGTPQGKNWFYEMYEKGLDDEYDKYSSLSFSSNTNPHFPEEEWEEVKGQMPEAIFKQEYEAAFIERAGMVYHKWNRNIHVVPSFEVPPYWYVYAGVDFGFTHPFAVVWVAIDPDGNYWIIDEYYEPKRSMNEHIMSLKGRPWNVNMYFGDPSGPQFMNEMSRRGMYIGPANRDVIVGINRVSELLESGRLKVFAHCQHIIREFEHYMWADAAQRKRKDMKEEPLKMDDHALDALRYCVMMTYDSRGKEPVRKKSEVQRWRDSHFKGKKKRDRYATRDEAGGILIDNG